VIAARRPWAAAIDRAIGAVVEPVAAALVVVEVLVLGAGVFFRYALRSPLDWTDELAGLVLVWLAMLGAVVAYRRGEHIRLAALPRRVSAAVAELLEAISCVVVCAFALELAFPAYKLFLLERIELTPSLSIPRSYEVLPIEVGLGAIFVLALVRLCELDRRAVAISVIASLAVAAALWTGRGALAGLGTANLLIFFVGFVGLFVAIGIPIAFAFGVGTLSYLAVVTRVPLNTVVGRMDEGMSALILLAVPMFIFLGAIMESSGIAKRLVAAIASLVGHWRGGLNVVLVVAMYLVSGISGSKFADMAAVAPVLFPDMERRGYRRPAMIALLATSGAMAETIPPCLVLIVIGSVTGVSIGALFSAGLLPAVVCSIALITVALLFTRNDAVEIVRRATFREIVLAVVVAIPGLLLPLIIRSTVAAGIATATEVSVVGIVYTLLVGFAIYRELDWRTLYPGLLQTVTLSGAILFIIGSATAMSWALTQSGFAAQLASLLAHAPGGRTGVLFISIAMFVVLGSVLEGIPAVVLFAPLLFPIAVAAGIDEIHYAICIVLAMGVGLFSPPLGVGFFSACAIGKAEPEHTVRPMLPYLGALIVSLALIALFPQIALLLVHRGR
jgi:tripartite ATP-independent transporter DctM subunit